MTATIELCYNGDYPGYPCIKLNDKWATGPQERAVCEIFGVEGLRELYTKAGAKLISEEHERRTGTITLTLDEQ